MKLFIKRFPGLVKETLGSFDHIVFFKGCILSLMSYFGSIGIFIFAILMMLLHENPLHSERAAHKTLML